MTTPDDGPLTQAKPPFLRRVRSRGYKSIASWTLLTDPHLNHWRKEEEYFYAEYAEWTFHSLRGQFCVMCVFCAKIMESRPVILGAT